MSGIFVALVFFHSWGVSDQISDSFTDINYSRTIIQIHFKHDQAGFG